MAKRIYKKVYKTKDDKIARMQGRSKIFGYEQKFEDLNIKYMGEQWKTECHI